MPLRVVLSPMVPRPVAQRCDKDGAFVVKAEQQIEAFVDLADIQIVLFRGAGLRENMYSTPVLQNTSRFGFPRKSRIVFQFLIAYTQP